MDDIALRDNLIKQAQQAMLAILLQINILLEAAQTYVVEKPASSKIREMQHKELNQSVNDLGTIPRMLVDEIANWKNGKDRVLGRDGIETFLLADLLASMDSMYWFFSREDIDVITYSSDIVMQSICELIRCNRLI